jgi:DNA adenine methylase
VVEVYNDLDGSLVNLFQVIRDRPNDFRELLSLVPYSREDFSRSLGHDSEHDSIRRAVDFYAVLNQSISGKRLARKGDWARGRLDNLAERYFARQEGLGIIHERIKHIQIECRDALDILEEWDGPDTTFYCDPPYVLETRSKRRYYAVEPGDEYHKQLVGVLLGVQGNVVLSGYEHPVYNKLVAKGWKLDTYGSLAVMQVVQEGDQKQKRVEVVYRNPSAADKAMRRPLFY